MAEHKPLQHAAMDQFQTRDNQLLIGDQTLSQLAQQVAQTPFYAYDRALISQRITALKTQLPPAIELHYAIKANPMPALVQHIAGHVQGLDVASLGEMQVALDTGINPIDISFTGPGKSNRELTAALTAGVIINVESPRELARITDIARSQEIKANLSLRVNPDFELKTSGMKMSGGAKPFGIDAEQLPEILQTLDQQHLTFYGLHIFCGSQNLRSDALIEAHNKTFALAHSLRQHLAAPLRWLNIGGGFGVPYFPGDRHLELTPVCENLARLIDVYQKDFADTQMIIELGRYLVAEAGIYVCEVIDKKVSRGETFVITNGGLHHHLAASGNFGQVIRKNYPVAVGNRLHSDKKETVTIVGPLCTPLDILASKMELPVIGVGDLIVVYQSGAYGLSASPQNFLSHPPAVEVFL